MNKPKLNQLEMLVAVADTGSFGAAAAELACTQSRISHAITELEACLGARLLTRSRTGCAPTEAGQRVLAKARQMLRLAAGLAGAADVGAGLVGRVRIACFRSVATHVLPQALAALAVEYPGIRVDIDDSCEERQQVARAVADGRAEIGIGQLPVAADLLVRNYVADSYVLVVPASFAARAPLSWDQLKDLPYIQLDCSGALAVLAQCRAAGFAAEPSRTLATDSAVAAMVGLGLAYSILPRLAVFPEPQGVRVVDLPIAAKRQFALLALPGTARLEAVDIVLRYVGNKRIVGDSPAFRAGLLAW
ncbi:MULTISPECIES: LysR family transcriptional regulator [unclassified Janthinobacterium]|uniref:LysR family transcriptional regulator n=1 Tax=unclassified Janthinobacterium TaxID=2610881 RepID=UPI00034820CA|nr:MULTISPECIES: LysR family transcriptional regulator [unclassified Janthinobacterium]MEC5162768.1 DNA-binding transcriptional LysR family regulator [Janthinobacterium sp. CG_S6]